MKYTREEFVSLMAKMQDKYSAASKVADGIDALFGCGAGIDFLETSGFNWYMDYLVETLEKMFEEEIDSCEDADVISWYIYENDFGSGNGVYQPDVRCFWCQPDVHINSAGELYDYMMRKKK